MKKSNVIVIFLIVVIIVIVLIGSFITFKPKNNKQDNLSNNTNNINTNNIENTSIDESEKIGKLYNRPNQIYNEKNHIKEISKNESNDILNIINGSEKILAIIDYINSANYIIEYNDKNIKKIEFRTAVNNSIIANRDGDFETYNIYKEKDVLRLKEILNIKNDSNVVYSVIDINKISAPPTLYINSTKIYQSTFSWKQNDSSIVNVDTISPQEMLKNVEPVLILFSPVVSTNEDLRLKTLSRLPSNAIIKYTIYKGSEIVSNDKNAEAMIDGSYHFEILNIKGEYIYVLDLTFEGLNSIHSTYCFKCKV